MNFVGIKEGHKQKVIHEAENSISILYLIDQIRSRTKELRMRQVQFLETIYILVATIDSENVEEDKMYIKG